MKTRGREAAAPERPACFWWIFGTVCHFTLISLVPLLGLVLIAVQWPWLWAVYLIWRAVAAVFLSGFRPWPYFKEWPGWPVVRHLVFGRRKARISGPGKHVLLLAAASDAARNSVIITEIDTGADSAFATKAGKQRGSAESLLATDGTKKGRPLLSGAKKSPGPANQKENSPPAGREENSPPPGPGMIIATHPHGAAALGATLGIALEHQTYVDSTPTVHSGLFHIPFIGAFAQWLGSIPANRAAMCQTLASGHNILMAPDGVNDILLKDNEVNERVGFLEIAMTTGSPVLPVWLPRERSYFTVWSPMGNCLKGPLGYPIPCLVWPRWGLHNGWLPYPMLRTGIDVVVGAPILPSDFSNLSELKQAYYDALRALVEPNH